MLTFSSIVGALSFALDLTEGAEPGHALRTCLLGMRIGRQLGLSRRELSHLYYALLLKDAGCSSNAERLCQIVGGDERQAKAFTKTNDWTRFEWRQFRFLFQSVHTSLALGQRVRAIGSMVKNSSRNAEQLFRLRCTEGANVVRTLGLGTEVADAIYSLDEHWDGKGYPDRLQGKQIPVLSRILGLAQTLEVFHQQYGPQAALDCIRKRSGRWFDPALVWATLTLARQGELWTDLEHPRLRELVMAEEPFAESLPAAPEAIDNICLAFAGVIDSKSHTTFRHSTGVARISVALAGYLGFADTEMTTLRRAALLHDVGKLGVPNSILEKPGRPDAAEWACIQNHPRWSFEILSRIPTFGTISQMAAGHHEKLDGSGYYQGLRGADLSLSTRILTVADIYEALTARRSYHEPRDPAQAMAILEKDAPHALDPECVRAMRWIVENGSLERDAG